MWKGMLTDSELKAIGENLPAVNALRDQTLRLSPDMISIHLHPYPDSTVPMAAVCFRDLADTLWAVNYALFQCGAHGTYYRKDKSPHAEITAVLFEKYYLDDAALRLYSAGEHLATAVKFMLELPEEQLGPFKKQRSSQQAVVGTFLAARKPDHCVTAAVTGLSSSKEWQSAVDYRNKWVHDQPPPIDGMGLVFRRCNRWEKSPDGTCIRLGLVATDPAEYTIDQVKGFIMPATQQLLEASIACFDHYLAILAERRVILPEKESHEDC
jgi:hypothetical protein